MKSMKEVCLETGLSYETLKYYCNEGLVPNHQRDSNNHRKFDEKDIAWIKGLVCLRQCEMSLIDIKRYMGLCIAGIDSIPQRKIMLEETRNELLLKLEKIQESLAYIDQKQSLYDKIIAGEIKYVSNFE
ncbi:MerR family transcriptional regulator [Erysipelothrix urinaevulpis]|uniref:MerR family transcriptional regulator n=1 Tax=Erysipelothrix urinaevulpis TaxID=2683717 RepID=UPI001359DFB2|nr:MerR family transcriptional regulator [Erysipelothrix urinaevulpis]